MHIPDEPPIGNLVAYEYLWLSQETTREDGAKAYPVALIFAKKIIASVAFSAFWSVFPTAILRNVDAETR